jgi:predicted transcriptional regulator
MEISLSNETQDRLARIAAQRGSDSSTLVVEAIDRMLDYEEWFLEAVEAGIAAADRGELIDHEEVARMIARRFPA